MAVLGARIPWSGAVGPWASHCHELVHNPGGCTARPQRGHVGSGFMSYGSTREVFCENAERAGCDRNPPAP